MNFNIATIRMTPLLLMLMLTACGSGGSDSTPAEESPAVISSPSSTSSVNKTIVASFFAPDFVFAGDPFLLIANSAINASDAIYTWSIPQSPAGSSPIINADGAAAAITTDLVGTYVVMLTVTGSDGSSDSASRNVSVIASTPAPDASFTVPEFVTAGEAFVVSANTVASQLNYTWEVTDRPSQSNPQVNPNGAEASFLLDRPGEYSILLTVDDGNGQSDSQVQVLNALSAPIGTVITQITISSLAANSTTASDIPVTFGQLFARGDIAAGNSVDARLENGATAPLQVDVKSRYPDGSLKHAVLSTIVPSLQGGQDLDLELMACEEHEQFSNVELSDLPADYDAVTSINIGGTTWTASLRQSMQSGAAQQWMEGFVATEAHFVMPFLNASGSPHPLLSARFQLRLYATGDARTSIVVENASALGETANNLNYTVEISSGQTTIMPSEQVNHYHHSRWRKIAWLGNEPEVHLERDVAYLVSTGAIPNYDFDTYLDPGAIAALKAKWNTGSGAQSGIRRDAIMGAGVALENMPNTGGRMDFGLLPGWTAMYMFTMDDELADVTFGTADAAGHWPIHYRDSATDLPISLEENPGLTIHPNVFNSSSNPLPPCNNCGSGLDPDTAHQPSLVFVPYLLTGDYYYLEEQHFWTNYNSFFVAPDLRGHGTIHYGYQQIRAQAWSMRTLLQTVFITPDDHPQKAYFDAQLTSNIQHYTDEYLTNSSANRLGWIKEYHQDYGRIAPWMDDFFTAALNYGRHMGFDQLQPMLEWKLQYAENRMTDPVYCWQFATAYRIKTRAVEGVWFQSMGEAYIPTLEDQFASRITDILAAQCGTNSMADAVGFAEASDFVGWPEHPAGYPASLRVVVAAAVELNQDWAPLAWDRLVNAPSQPKFYQYPTFAIIPR
ncbi:MAG: hypothetical protein HKM98_05680 [Gammaproteobacteria bacterium]|nr:hypothetical protein [Gammaproteobacteria bacterium]